MMDIRKVYEDFYVGPQIRPEDVEQLAREGFATIICNRPDGEEPGQPPVEAVRKAAQQHGIAFHHIPVSGGQFPQDAIEAFLAARQASAGKTFAFCRTGTRSITLETLANPKGLSVSERLKAAQAAGYDLAPLAAKLGD